MLARHTTSPVSGIINHKRNGCGTASRTALGTRSKISYCIIFWTWLGTTWCFCVGSICSGGVQFKTLGCGGYRQSRKFGKAAGLHIVPLLGLNHSIHFKAQLAGSFAEHCRLTRQLDILESHQNTIEQSLATLSTDLNRMETYAWLSETTSNLTLEWNSLV